MSHDSHRLHLWVHDTICIVCTILFSNHSPALCHHSGDCIGILFLILLLCPAGVIVDNLKGDMSELMHFPSVKFPGLKMYECKNDKNQVWVLLWIIWRVICLSSGAVQPSGKRRRKVQLEIKRTNANISVSRGKCTIFTRIAFLHFKESCRSVQWGFVQYVKLIFSLFKSGGGGGGSDMAPIWSWLSCSISLNCHKYFSDTSNIFVPMWLLGSRLGADMIATWRRYDSATYC